MAEITIGTVPSITRTPWSRKSDWLTMPSVSSSEEKVVILHAVREESEFVAFTIAGAYTVDWGDGTVENFATGATAEHEYDYTNVQLDGTLTSGGYKQALIIITPQAGQNLTNLNFQVKHSTSGLQAYSSGFLDIILSGPNLTSLTVGGTTIGHRLLERAEFLNIGSVTTMQNMFYDCTSLQSVPLFDTSSVTNMSAMFYDCTSLQSVPAFDVSLVTDFTYIFFNNRTLSYVGANNVSYSISVAGCKLSNTALETIFTNLTDITPANNQTITITNNYGSSTANTTIATDKGWTVTN